MIMSENDVPVPRLRGEAVPRRSGGPDVRTDGAFLNIHRQNEAGSDGVKNILFVCTGNTCRSPMAAALLRQKAADRYAVQSAGIFALDGQNAHPNVEKVLAKRGIPFDHRSQSLTKELVDWADLIITMTMGHKTMILERYPEATDKTFTLKEFAADPKERQEWQKAVADWMAKRTEYNRLKRDEQPDSEALKELEEAVRQAETRVQALQDRMQDWDVPDPFGAPEEIYDKVCRELETLIERFLEKDV